MPVITVTRQYGSQGDQIARQVAARLGLTLVDRDIVAEVAKRLNVPETAVDELDERGGTLVHELVRSMQQLYPATHTAPGHMVEAVRYRDLVRTIIQERAKQGNVVIVGRGSTYLLSHEPGILHLLIIAPLDVRAARVAEWAGIALGQAVQRVKSVDASRARYARHVFGADWLDTRYYDLVLSTGLFSVERATELVVAAA